MKKVIAIFLATAGTFVAEASMPTKIAPEDLKSLVESRNELVRGKSSEIEGAESREGSLRRSFLPTAELFAAQERFKKGPLSERTQPTYGAEVRLNLYNGGRDKIEGERRELTSQRRKFERAQTVSVEVSKAREAYWRAVYERDFIELLKVAREGNRENLRAADRRIKSGVATDADRVEFEMQDMELQRELELAELSRKNHLRGLVVVLGFDAGSAFELTGTLAQHPHDWEAGISHTEADHSFLVKPAELSAQETDKLATVHRRTWVPKIDAYAAYAQLNQRAEEAYAEAEDRRESVVGLRLTMNLFDGISGRREAAALSREADAARAQARYVHQEVEAHLHGEIAELKLLHDQVHGAEESIKKAERYLGLTKGEYARGVKNSPDMLGATEKLTSARRRRLEIIRDFQIAQAHVLAKIGK